MVEHVSVKDKVVGSSPTIKLGSSLAVDDPRLEAKKKKGKSMDFLERLNKETNIAYTENGAKAYSTTGHACLDFFAMGAAKRKSPRQAVGLFQRALGEDAQTAVRTLFYIRDVRGGQGEREIFRYCLGYLSANAPEIAEKITPFIPEYGRWDDLLYCTDNVVAKRMVRRQLDIDAKSKHPSLLAKWMPSLDSKWHNDAKFWMESLGVKSERTYRKKLSKIRKKLNLLETKMSEKKLEEIDYSKLSGQAFRKHTKALRRGNNEKVEQFFKEAVKAAEKGEKIIKTGTVYPYEVFDLLKQDTLAADAFWKNLPEYPLQDALVMVDTSGSMYGRPLNIALSLGLYYAERNKGYFHNRFLTFSNKPTLQAVLGSDLASKLDNMSQANWDMNTNVSAALDAVFNAAKDSRPEEVPKTILIISDMEFDSCTESDKTPYEANRAKWEEAGLTMPTVVFWNVDSRQNQTPTVNEKGVLLISGASPSAFQFVTEGKTPYELMMKVVNSDRYSQILL